MENWSIYKHTCPNGKVYIGITSYDNVNLRWANGKGYKHNAHFSNAVKKYGWSNIEHEILFDGLTKKEACQKEIELIAFYKSNDTKYGYNQSTGGECSTIGVHWSKEQRMRMSEAHKGKKHSEETKQKLKGSAKNRRKPVLQFDKDGNFIREYAGVKEACEKTGICLIHCLRGKCKTSGGYIWKYKEEYYEQIKTNETV